MRNILITIAFSIIPFINEGQNVNLDSLQWKWFKFYEKGQKKPFTGRAFAYGNDRFYLSTTNGKTLVEFKNGRLDGNYKSWYDSIEKTIAVEGHFEKGRWSGEYIGYYDNGKKSYLSFFKNGKLNGIQNAWYKNGQKQTENSYKKGIKDGIQIEWYENGQKKSEEHYKNDVVDVNGVNIYWYENGQKSWESFNKGVKTDGDGIQVEWYENGQKKKEAFYKNGRLNGRKKEWYVSGAEKSEMTFKNGKSDGVSYECYVGGETASEGFWKKGKGVNMTYYQNGQKSRDEYYKKNYSSWWVGITTSWSKTECKINEEKHSRKYSVQTDYHINGQKRSEGVSKRNSLRTYFIGDFRQTYFIEWYQNGQKYREIKYKTGIFYPENKRGTCGITSDVYSKTTYWYENGNKKKEFKIYKNEENGLYTKWYENGQKSEEGKYKKGVKTGEWIYWKENGEVERVEEKK